MPVYFRSAGAGGGPTTGGPIDLGDWLTTSASWSTAPSSRCPFLDLSASSPVMRCALSARSVAVSFSSFVSPLCSNNLGSTNGRRGGSTPWCSNNLGSTNDRRGGSSLAKIRKLLYVVISRCPCGRMLTSVFTGTGVFDAVPSHDTGRPTTVRGTRISPASFGSCFFSRWTSIPCPESRRFANEGAGSEPPPRWLKRSPCEDTEPSVVRRACGMRTAAHAVVLEFGIARYPIGFREWVSGLRAIVWRLSLPTVSLLSSARVRTPRPADPPSTRCVPLSLS